LRHAITSPCAGDAAPFELCDGVAGTAALRDGSGDREHAATVAANTIRTMREKAFMGFGGLDVIRGYTVRIAAR
jgi:hypothetical protein